MLQVTRQEEEMIAREEELVKMKEKQQEVVDQLKEFETKQKQVFIDLNGDAIIAGKYCQFIISTFFSMTVKFGEVGTSRAVAGRD